MRIALFQPEIAGNMGAVLRIAACFGVAVDVIEPMGFILSDARLRRAGMDYIDHVALARHDNWDAFVAATPGRRILLTTKGDVRIHDWAFERDDILLMGSESSGVPPAVAQDCAARVRIPIGPHVRSLNLSVATGIAIAEALRQTGELP